MSTGEISRAQIEEEVRMGTDLYNRIHFLHWAIDDTQNTIRFLDTKAAFCVTLFSGMVAVSLEHPLTTNLVKHILFPIFIVIVAASLLICLRVIFPIIIPHGGSGPPASPKFFIGHKRGNKWVRNTVRNPSGNILSESHSTHIASMHAADDTALLNSLAETAVTLAFIRQIKSDRMHAAMWCLGAAILLFGAIMLVQV